MTISKSNPNLLFVSLSDANNYGSIGLFKSTDSGNSWDEITNAPNALCVPTVANLCQGWYVNVVAISPYDSDLIFYGGTTFWRSTNGGTEAGLNSMYILQEFIHRAKPMLTNGDRGFHPQEQDVIYVFNDGGVQKSINKGAWWDKINNGLVTGLVHRIASSATDATLIIGGFQDHGLQKLNNTNGNLFWKRWSDNDGTNVIIDPNNNNIFLWRLFSWQSQKKYKWWWKPSKYIRHK